MDNTSAVLRLKDAAVVAALHHVPPTHLSIYDLWRDLVDKNGNLDTLRASERAEEIQTAVDQAEAYVAGTRAALRQVQMLTPSEELGPSAEGLRPMRSPT